MSDWALTLGLQNLRNQVNAAFPDRDKASDGTIGDKAHQAETSGHNPDDTSGSRPEWNGDPDSSPEVRAWDMDSDLRTAPATAQQVVDHIRGLPGVASVLRYMIYNRKIYKAANGWRAEAYTGASAHTEHIHFDGAWSQAADNNISFNYRLEEIPVALTSADKSWLADQIEAVAQKVVDAHIGSKTYSTRTVGDELNDLAEVRAALVFNPGQSADGKSVPADAPIRRLVAAADVILADAKSAKP